MNRTIEIREWRSGEILISMTLYEFLATLHTRLPDADEYAFNDLQILIDGEELLPCACGHA